MKLNQILDALHARYQEKQAQRMPDVFPPPAAPADIAAAEAALGMTLPDELRALYSRHAWMTNVWEDVSITSVEFIADEVRSLSNVAYSMAADAAQDDERNDEPFVTPSGPVAPVIYAASRIPFGSQNGGHRQLLIDLEPPAGGTPGQIIRLDIECGTIEVVANSLTEFFAQGLETFSSQKPGAFREPGRLASRLLLLAGLPVMLVVTIGGMLVAVAVIAWGAASMVAESIAGLFVRKQK